MSLFFDYGIKKKQYVCTVIILIYVRMRRRFLSIFFFFFWHVTLLAQHAEWRDYIENKQFEKIITEVGDLQPADSADFNKMYLIGQAYEGLLRYKDAYSCYKHCYLLDSTRIEVLNPLARMAAGLGKMKEAEKYYLIVLASDSDNFNANYQLARLYVSFERYEESLYYYGLLLEKDTTNSIMLRAIGDCFKNLDLLGTALDFYRKAYNANVENASLASQLINTLLKLYNPFENNNALEALSICDTAMTYHPEHKTLRQNKAMTHYVLNEFVKADSIYTSLLADKDSSYITLKYCGCARYYARKWYDAIEPLEKAFDIDPTAFDVCALLGNCLGKTYDPVQAFQLFDKAESIMAPDIYWSNKVMQFRAELYIKTGNYKKGVGLYYQLWKDDETQLSWLQLIQRCYLLNDKMTDEERQRCLFINYLYATEALKSPKSSEMPIEIAYLHSTLKKFEEEMFFRGVTSLPMLSPDNKQNTLSLEKLKELTGQLSGN